MNSQSAAENFIRKSKGAPSGFFEMSLKAKVERELYEAKKGFSKSIEKEYVR